MNYPEGCSQGSDQREKCRKVFWKKTTGSKGGEIKPTENAGKEARTFYSDFSSFLHSLWLWVQQLCCFRERKTGISPPRLSFGEFTSLQKKSRFCVAVKVTIRVHGRMHM